MSNAKHTPGIIQRVKARLSALNEAGTVICSVLVNGDFFVILVPTWSCGNLYYRFVEYTPFNQFWGLGITANTYYSAELGLVNIFKSARASLARETGA